MTDPALVNKAPQDFIAYSKVIRRNSQYLIGDKTVTLSINDRLVYVELYDRYRFFKNAGLSHHDPFEHYARELDMSVKSVSRSMKKLEDAGIIARACPLNRNYITTKAMSFADMEKAANIPAKPSAAAKPLHQPSTGEPKPKQSLRSSDPDKNFAKSRKEARKATKPATITSNPTEPDIEPDF